MFLFCFCFVFVFCFLFVVVVVVVVVFCGFFFTLMAIPPDGLSLFFRLFEKKKEDGMVTM